MVQPVNTNDYNLGIDPLRIGNKQFKSRLMLGTGKYRSLEDAKQSIINSGCQILTVAVRRAQNSTIQSMGSLIHGLDWSQIWLMPNTAGCQTAQEAIRVAFLGREIVKNLGFEDNNFTKLEVIPDPKYLLPDGLGTLLASEYLISKGFIILPYINADPILAKHLENTGCATVMPLGSPIGSGQGLKNMANIQIIVENANVPVIVDAGIGSPSQAAKAMELGADGILVNTAVAKAQDSPRMAYAMKLSVVAGRLAFQAGQIQPTQYAQPSSPISGLLK
jgi:thiazole synthase